MSETVEVCDSQDELTPTNMPGAGLGILPTAMTWAFSCPCFLFPWNKRAAAQL